MSDAAQPCITPVLSRGRRAPTFCSRRPRWSLLAILFDLPGRISRNLGVGFATSALQAVCIAWPVLLWRHLVYGLKRGSELT